ncbi:MAG: hypothetical protein K9L28_10585 [Synergistales bacterium]|nr:hypothetical protein [Synergistales bacterium]
MLSTAAWRRDTIIGARGITVAGHRFHRSWCESEVEPPVFDIRKKGDASRQGLYRDSTLAVYLQVHSSTRFSCPTDFPEAVRSFAGAGETP